VRRTRLKNLFRFGSLLLVVAALPVSVYLVQNITNYFLTARGEPANLVIDVGSSRVVSAGLWRNFSQGGETKDGMLEPIVKEIAQLEADYVRLDHIYDYYDVVGRDGGSLRYDWTRLDREIDAILAAGAKPFLSLSYTPSALSVSGASTDLPANWQEWSELVRATVEHFSGSKAIAGVYYEVWNEPDLFGDFKTYGEKDYLELYRYSVAGAMAAQNVKAFKIGGPATTGAYENWFNNLLRLTSENSLRLDFLSWHRYSSNLDDYESDVKLVKDLLAGFPQYSNIELIISELGPNSENDPVYDSKTGAIHSLATTAVLDRKVGKAFSFELQDGKGPEKYWGRWGILTNSEFPPVDRKPRYSAFLFLNSLVGRQVDVSGQGSWVKAMARVNGDTVKILVSNFDKDDKHFETVPVRLVNLADGNWVYRRKDFLGGETQKEIIVEGGEYSTLELFSPNSAAILELEPAQ